MNAQAPVTSLLLLASLASCNAVGQNTRSISQANDHRYNEQRHPGENRLQFGIPELENLMNQAYANLHSQAERRDLDWVTVMSAASTDKAMPLVRDIESRTYNGREDIKTDIDEGFAINFEEAFNAVVSSDTEAWSCKTMEEARAYCGAAGVSYPDGLFLPDQQARVREAVSKDEDPFEYVMLAELYGARENDDQVSFRVKIKMISLLEDMDPIHEESDSFTVWLPIDTTYELKQKIGGLRELGSLLD